MDAVAVATSQNTFLMMSPPLLILIPLPLPLFVIPFVLTSFPAGRNPRPTSGPALIFDQVYEYNPATSTWRMHCSKGTLLARFGSQIITLEYSLPIYPIYSLSTLIHPQMFLLGFPLTLNSTDRFLIHGGIGFSLTWLSHPRIYDYTQFRYETDCPNDVRLLSRL